jgi:phosphoglycolate phosphatase
MLRAVIRLITFDLDGTLIDSVKDLTDAANALLAELGGPPLPDEAVARMVGEGAAVLVRRALTAAGIDPGTPAALERFLDLYDARLLANTRVYPTTMEMLVKLAERHRLAVLTNKPAAASERILEGLGIRERFHAVIGGDTPFGRKPNPAGLLHLVETAGVAPASTLLVGDSRVDLETARRAGTRICLARYGFGYQFDEEDFDGTELFVDQPADLVTLMAALHTDPR